LFADHLEVSGFSPRSTFSAPPLTHRFIAPCLQSSHVHQLLYYGMVREQVVAVIVSPSHHCLMLRPASNGSTIIFCLDILCPSATNIPTVRYDVKATIISLFSSVDVNLLKAIPSSPFMMLFSSVDVNLLKATMIHDLILYWYIISFYDLEL
jgi:hypothetical protein